MARAVMVVTSHEALGDTGKKTGFYWEELAAPYWALRDAGVDVEIASIEGGKPPADPGSAEGSEVTDDVRRFWDDGEAMKALEDSRAVGDLDSGDYDLVFLPGGHGAVWDMPDNPDLGRLLAGVHDRGGIVGAVCHGPAGLLSATLPDGKPLVAGKRVAGFTNSEERAVGLTDVVPYLLADRLREQGADHSAADDFTSHAVSDQRLVTGQNPQSSAEVGRLLVEALTARRS